MSFIGNNLYVAKSSLLLHPLQLHQQGAQVPHIQPPPMQRRSQGKAIHWDCRVVQKVLQLPSRTNMFCIKMDPICLVLHSFKKILTTAGI